MDNNFSGFSTGGMSGTSLRSTIKQFNDSMVAANPPYEAIDLGIGTKEGTETIVSDSMSQLKNSFPDSPGMDYNVTMYLYQTMMNPQARIMEGDRMCFERGGVGIMHPYDKDGNPTTGTFSMSINV